MLLNIYLTNSETFLFSSDKLGHFKFSRFNLDNNLEEEEITRKPRLKKHKDSIKDVAFSPSDSKFMTCSTDKLLKLWDTHRVECLETMQGHGSDVLSVDWHPWMNLVASGGKDRLLKIWNIGGNQKNILNLYHHTNSINVLKYCINL